MEAQAHFSKQHDIANPTGKLPIVGDGRFGEGDEDDAEEGPEMAGDKESRVKGPSTLEPAGSEVPLESFNEPMNVDADLDPNTVSSNDLFYRTPTATDDDTFSLPPTQSVLGASVPPSPSTSLVCSHFFC